MTSSYGDATKSISDLLNKAYCLDSRKVKVTSKTSAGLALTFDGKIAKGKSSGSASVDVGKLTDNISVDKLSFESNGKVVTEAGISGLADGLSTTVKIEENLLAEGLSCNVEANYATENINVDAEFSVLNGPSVTVSALGSFDGLLVGGTSSVDGANSFAVTDFGGLIGYRASNFSMIAKAENKCADTSLNYSYKLCSSSTLAGKIGYKTESGDTSCVVGGNYKVSGTSEVQARASCAGTIGANVTTKINGSTKLNLAAEIDAMDLASDSHKFGLSLTFGF